uniref:Uncharacterized protein n=1 Tax=Plectus sambesii TaxID=2011161 RepID=A0A914VGU9_9BILA
MSRSSSHRQVKKVGVPIVPDMPSPSPMLPRDGSASCVLPRGRCGTSSYGSMEALSTQNSPAHRVVYGYPSHQNGNTLNGIAENPRSTTPSNGNRSPQHHSTGGPQIVGQPSTQASSSSTLFQQHLQQRIASPDCQRAAGVAVSPRHRNSTGSNSSQASSGFESMKVWLFLARNLRFCPRVHRFYPHLLSPIADRLIRRRLRAGRATTLLCVGRDTPLRVAPSGLFDSLGFVEAEGESN